MIKKLFSLFFLFWLGAAKLFAQGNWGGGVDDENLHFGFTFQYVAPQFVIQKAANWREPLFEEGNPDSPVEFLKSISSPANSGFGLGFVSDFYLTKHLNFRFTPTLVFVDRIIDYEFESGGKDDYNQAEVELPAGKEGVTRRSVFSTMVEFPFLLKLKSDRRNNFRAYLIGGAKYGVDIAKKKMEDNDKIYFQKYLKNQKGFWSYEAGIGFDLYFEYFKMSPEIKLSNSFKSILKRDNEPYSSTIDKLFLRTFMFSLYFE